MTDQNEHGELVVHGDEGELHVKGEQGEQGIRGSQGPQGEQGDAITRTLILPDAKSWWLDLRYIASAIVTVLALGMVFALYAINNSNNTLARSNDQLAGQRDFLQQTIDANSVELTCRAAAVAVVDTKTIDELNAIGDGTYIVVQGLTDFAAGDRAALEQTLADAGVIKANFAVAKKALLDAQAARVAALESCAPPSPTVPGG